MSSQYDLDPHLVECIRLLHESKNLRKGDQPPLQKVLEKALYEEYGIKRDYTDFFQSHLPPREESARSMDNLTNNATETVEISDSDDDLSINDGQMDETWKSLLGDDILCARCRKMTVEANNRLLECNTCHNLYHQLCHQPPIKHYEETWFCIKCLVPVR